jgi:hypothetical protein
MGEGEDSRRPGLVDPEKLEAQYCNARVSVACRHNPHGHGDIGARMVGAFLPDSQREVEEAHQEWDRRLDELGTGNAREVSGAEESQSAADTRSLRGDDGIPGWMDRPKRAERKTSHGAQDGKAGWEYFPGSGFSMSPTVREISKVRADSDFTE